VVTKVTIATAVTKVTIATVVTKVTINLSFISFYSYQDYHCHYDCLVSAKTPEVCRYEDIFCLVSFFWVTPRRLNFIYRCFGTLCLFHLHRSCNLFTRSVKVEQSVSPY
jgi:hypothetical protein